MNKLTYGTTEDALDLILSGENCCITGPGGSGKSHLIGTIKTFFESDTIFVAPTGLAALNIGGQTCHRTFGLGFGVYKQGLPFKLNKERKAVLSSKQISRIVIDEAFSLRTDKFIEIIDKLKWIRKIKKGQKLDLQVILLGDCLQIGPVTSQKEYKEFYENYDSPYVFDCETFNELDFKRIELTKIYRQSDVEFKSILNKVRKAEDVRECCHYLNSKVVGKPIKQNSVVIATTNKDVDRINKTALNKIEGFHKTFYASVVGDFKEQPAPQTLELKVGAQVIITANSGLTELKQTYINGNVGVVEKITNYKIDVRIADDSELKGELVSLSKHTWYNVEQYVYKHPNGREELKERMIGSYEQFPVKLGFAISAHKSQGQTFSDAHLDFGYRCFAPSQAYVALSRVKSVEGITFERPIKPEDIFVDSKALRYYS
jgi:ATP-dependent exoDNAse (exonuclease V) alpha subunit